MKCKYTRARNKEKRKTIALPMLSVRLGYAGNQLPNVVCLIDTGATDSLFDAEVAEELGIDVTSGEERDYQGISGPPVVGYVHRVGLQVQGFSEWIEIEAGFIEGLPTNLLGQSGFMDNYEITFRRFRGRFEIKSRSFLHGH